MKNRLFYVLTLSACLLLSSCMSDELGIQTQSPFTISTTNTPTLVQVKDTVEFRLTINPSPYLSSTQYRISYQNTDSALPVHVGIGRKAVGQGEWMSVNDLSPWIAIRCDAGGQPKVLFYVKNDAGDLQAVEVGYTSSQ